MKKILTILLIIFATIGLLFGIVSTAKAQGENKDKQSSDPTVSILDYALKPVGYVQGDRFVKSKWDMELKNNEGTTKNVNIKIRFYDKDLNMLREVEKKVNIKASQTKKYSDEVLLDTVTAKKVNATRALIEDVK
jgi:hypothetical protein